MLKDRLNQITILYINSEMLEIFNVKTLVNNLIDDQKIKQKSISYIKFNFKYKFIFKASEFLNMIMY